MSVLFANRFSFLSLLKQPFCWFLNHARQNESCHPLHNWIGIMIRRRKWRWCSYARFSLDPPPPSWIEVVPPPKPLYKVNLHLPS
jgi:hypothetical protein